MAELDPTRAGGGFRQIAMIAGGALVAALALFALWYYVIRTPLAPAFTGLKSEDASIIVDELKRQKTEYELADNGATILVAEDQVDAARVNILGGDLPLKGTVGFELFNKTDMGLTEFAQKINYQRALQGELARTLMSLENIETARVHLSLPESEIFESDRRTAKASVTLTAKLGESIDGRTVVGVQRMVASAVPDLDPASVTVLDSAGQLLSQDSVPLPPLSAESQAQNAISQLYAARVREAIAPVVPDPLIRITVWVPTDATMDSTASGPSEPVAADDSVVADAKPTGSAERLFPIRITIAVPGFPPQDLRQRLQPLLTQSVGFDPTKGDTLTVVALPGEGDLATPAPPRAAAPAEVAPQKGWGDSSGLLTVPIVPIVAGILALALLAAVLRRFMLRQEMSIQERDEFADRLRLLLEEGRESNRGSV